MGRCVGYVTPVRRAVVAFVACCAAIVATAVTPALARADGISGTVTDASTHAAVGHLNVAALDPSGDYVNDSCTASDGTYSLDLAPGTYKLEFGFFTCSGIQTGSSAYAAQFYDNKSSLSGADPVSVTQGSTTTGIDAAMLPPGQITGQVIDAATDTPAANVEVDMLVPSLGDFAYEVACTAADGTYRVTAPGLPSGDVRLEFGGDAFPTDNNGPCGATANPFRPRFYQGASSLDTATPVALTAGTTTSGIDAQLPEGGRITGIVTDAVTHQPLLNVDVVLLNSQGYWVGSACTAADGSYELSGGGPSNGWEGLPAGPYRAQFSTPGGIYDFCDINSPLDYTTQFYDGRSSATAADPITVADNQVTSGINVAMVQPGGSSSSTYTVSPGGPTIQSTQGGPFAPPTGLIRARLNACLFAHPPAGRIGHVLKAAGYVCVFRAPLAGLLTLDWYSFPPNRTKLARTRKARPVLVAAGSKGFASTGTLGVKMALTARGRALLKHTKHQRIMVKATFTPLGGRAVTVTRTITLTR